MTITSSIYYKEITDLNEIKEIVSFQEEIWGDDVVTPLPQLVAALHHGGVIIGAFHEEKVIGFSYGFSGFKEGRSYLISHMTAVRSDYQNLGVGLALKLKQRQWAIDYGYHKIVWTYDPLEARNAYFNLVKLGGYTRQYIHTYYGEMGDKLNKGLPSDRFLIEWDIASDRVEQAILNRIKVETDVNNYPLLVETFDIYPTNKQEIGVNKGYLIPVPKNIQDIKEQNINAAKKWRFDLRQLFTDALGKGYVVTGMLKDQHPSVQFYILEKKTLGELDD